MFIFVEHWPPFYFFVIWVYSHFFTSETALRMFSVIMSMGALAMFYAVALFFLCRREAVMAVIWMALSPFHVWYAQEARPYSTASFLSLTAVYFFLKMIKTNERKYWFLWICVMILAVGTSYYCIILFILLGFFFLTKDGFRISFKGFLFFGMTGVLCVFFSPFLSIISHGQFWLPSPGMRTVLLTPLVFTAGYLAQPVQILFGVILCWFLWLRGIFVFWREDKNKFSFIFYCSILSIFFIFLLSCFGIPLYLDRQMIIFSPFFLICMVRAVGSITNNFLKSGAILVGVMFVISMIFGYDQAKIYCHDNAKGNFYQGVHPKKRYRILMDFVLSNLRPTDKVITADFQSFAIASNALWMKFGSMERNSFVFNQRMMMPFERVNLRLFENLWYRTAVCEADNECMAFSFSKNFQKTETVDVFDQRVWFICSSWDFGSPLSENIQFVKELISRKYKMTMSSEQDGFFIFLYQKIGSIKS
ncbi:MAG: glycosyltransferase family 39 protein [Candidatus Omnitrophota bacterium]